MTIPGWAPVNSHTASVKRHSSSGSHFPKEWKKKKLTVKMIFYLYNQKLIIKKFILFLEK